MLSLRSPVMAMAVSKDNTFALTVSADHLIVKYELSVRTLPCFPLSTPY